MSDVKMIGSMIDITKDDLLTYFHTTKKLKDWLLKDGYRPTMLSNYVLITLWEKPSLRTRVSFEAGMSQLGGSFITLKAYPPDGEDILLKEDTRDQARVLSSMGDVIMARVYNHSTIEILIQYSNVPVINGMSNEAHPMQMLTDLYTIQEKKGKLEGLNLVYFGEGSINTAMDMTVACATVGINFILCCPDYSKHSLLREQGFGYAHDKYWEEAQKRAQMIDSQLIVEHDPVKAIKQADVVYTDSWFTDNKPKEKDREDDIREIFLPYQVNKDLLKNAPEAIVMHCLPAYRDNEIAGDVIIGQQSVIYDQAENRMHVEKGILVELLKPFK